MPLWELIEPFRNPKPGYNIAKINYVVKGSS